MQLEKTHKYDEIIDLEYPLKTRDYVKHPRMTLEDRAKIFAPFAALKGHDEAIRAKEKRVVPRIELSEESKEYLDAQLHQIIEALDQGEHPIVTVVYFQKDKKSMDGEGEYIQFTGMAARFDETSRILQIVDKRLKLEDIYDIKGEELTALQE